MHELSTLRQVVFVSTDMVYGKQSHSPVSSQAELSPIGHYGQSKLQAESILLQASLATGIPVTIFRPRLIAGAGRLGTLKRLHGLVSRNLPIPIIGKGLNQYQFIAKEDVAKAILLAIGTKSSRVYNLGSDDPPKVKDLLSNAIELVGSKSRLLHLNEFTSLKALRALDWLGLSPLSPEQFEIANLNCVLDTSETKRELGWQPTKSDLQILLESFDYLSHIIGLDVK
jgi:dTDP-glucose 4,6-dehydratase